MNLIDDQGRAAAALEIKKAMRRGASGTLLQKHVNQERTRLGKSRWRKVADKIAAVVRGDELRKLASRDVDSAGQCSLKALRTIHDAGSRFERPDETYLRKLSVPPQSWNARNDSVTADTGASTVSSRQFVGDAKPSRLGPAHADSVAPRSALPTDDEDPTVKALKEIFSKGPQRTL